MCVAVQPYLTVFRDDALVFLGVVELCDCRRMHRGKRSAQRVVVYLPTISFHGK